MVLNSGTVLGSNAKRLQISDTQGERLLPGEGSTDPLVLQGRYVQLLHDDDDIGTRAYIQTYDSSYGHVYPLDGSFTEDMIASANRVRFYKYTNNTDSILPGDIVKCASTTNVLTQSTTVNSGAFTDYSINFKIFNQKVTQSGTYTFNYIHNGQKWEYNNVEVSLADYGITLNSSIGNEDTNISFDYTRYTDTIDNIPVVQGDLVLLKDQTDAADNGVYIVDTGAAWGRSASFDT